MKQRGVANPLHRVTKTQATRGVEVHRGGFCGRSLASTWTWHGRQQVSDIVVVTGGEDTPRRATALAEKEADVLGVL